MMTTPINPESRPRELQRHLPAALSSTLALTLRFPKILPRILFAFLFAAGSLTLTGCGSEDSHSHDSGTEHGSHEHEDEHDAGGHDDHGHDDGHDDGGHEHDGHDDEHDHDHWAVTVWGERFEIFTEVGPLVTGGSADAHIHVTRLEGFRPLADGSVAVALRGPGGEQVFQASEASRPGVFNVTLQPRGAGGYKLFFQVTDDTSALPEEIGGGEVSVGSATQPGGLRVAPAPRGGDGRSEPQEFFKEQQWNAVFATSWVRPLPWSASVSGPARLRPAAGGEATVTAPVDGRLAAAGTWPYPGQAVERGARLFRLLPRVSAERSVESLAADGTELEIQRETAARRLERLEELLALEAVSLREVEESRARLAGLEARLAAAKQDLASARSSRGNGGAATASALWLRSPIQGEVATVTASPGATVTAGEGIAQVVRTDPLWIDIALAPAAARRLAEAPTLEGVILDDGESPPLRLVTQPDTEGPRLVSVAPRLDAKTGTVSALLEISSRPGLILGTTVDAQILLSPVAAADLEGQVIPSSALVDDGGVAVVYLQLSGETFVRQEVDVLERQGDGARVRGLRLGQRLVTRGGEALRRASLLSSGVGHGHVH